MKTILFALLLFCTGPLLAAGNIDDISDQTTSHTGIGSSEKEACAMAQASASEDKRVAGPCTCEIRKNKNICYADSNRAGSRSATTKPSKALARPTVAQSCATLVKYRDNALVRDFDKSRKAFQATTNSLSLLDALDKELRFQKPKMLLNGVLLNVMLQLKTTGELIGDLLSINPETGALIASARAGSRKLERLFTAAEAVSTTEALLLDDDDFRKYILLEMAAEFHPIGAVLKTAVHYSDNIQDISRTADDTRATWSAIEASSASLRKQIASLDKKIKSNETRLRLINSLQNEIAQYCAQK